jgi:hypothetical protein
MTTNTQEYFGYNTIFWMGVVENVNDPVKMGRVQARIFGWHDLDKKAIPTESLPWAQITMSSDSASVSGIGRSPTGIKPGSWVVGLFMDGETARQPLVLGSIPGIPTATPNTAEGFNDPEGNYPEDSERHSINEPDTNRLARNDPEHEHPIYLDKALNATTNIKTSRGFDWQEPFINEWSEFKAQYPHNKVMETESGHVFEIDDTPGEERIHIYHKSGTYQEISKDGKKVNKVIGDNVTIVEGNDNHYVNQDLNTTARDVNTRARSMHVNASSGVVIKAGRAGVVIDGTVYINGTLGSSVGVTGSFADVTGRTVTVIDGIVVGIV